MRAMPFHTVLNYLGKGQPFRYTVLPLGIINSCHFSIPVWNLFEAIALFCK